MNRRRYFIPIFAALGVALVFVQRLVSHLLLPYEKAGGILRPAVLIDISRIYAAQLLGPALYLAAIAFGLWLALGTPVPHWTRNRWPRAVVAYYILDLPLVFLPPWGRWGFLLYLVLSFLGLVLSLWILSGMLHSALPLLILRPLLHIRLSHYLLLKWHLSSGAWLSAVDTVIILVLTGWWLRDAADQFEPSRGSSRIPQSTDHS